MEFRYQKLQLDFTALKSAFEALGQKLSEASKETSVQGQVPSDLLAQSILAARTQFESVRIAVETLAKDMLVAGIPGSDQLKTLASIDGLLQSAVAAENNKHAIDTERENALAVMDRVLGIRHREMNDFKPLSDCLAVAKELRQAIDAVKWPNRHSDSEGLLADKHVFSHLLTLVTRGGDLDDETWARLEETVTDAFGRPLGVAVSRSKLTGPAAGATAPAPQPVPVVKPAEPPKAAAVKPPEPVKAEAPKEEPKPVEAPKAAAAAVATGAPKPEAPKVEAAKAEAPKVEEPKVEAKPEAPKVEPPKPEVKAEAPKAEVKAEAPKAEVKAEEPKPEAPKPEPPKVEAPKVEVKAEAPKAEVKAEAAPVETKAEAPKTEAPKAEPPKVEPPKVEAKAEAPKAEVRAEAAKEELKAEPAPSAVALAVAEPPKAPEPAPKVEEKPAVKVAVASDAPKAEPEPVKAPSRDITQPISVEAVQAAVAAATTPPADATRIMEPPPKPATSTAPRLATAPVPASAPVATAVPVAEKPEMPKPPSSATQQIKNNEDKTGDQSGRPQRWGFWRGSR